VLGIGVDLVDNERLREALGRWGDRFRDRVFLHSEQAYCESRAAPWRHYAGRFAVKEAVSKAFGTGLGQSLGWLDVEVRRDADSGAPRVHLGPRAGPLARERGVREILVSLAHTRGMSVAQVLLLG
jgi:holo-[acyl-carrier protein] synthase